MKNKNFKIHKSVYNTVYIMDNTSWIGLYPALEEEHLNYSVEQLKKFFEK